MSDVAGPPPAKQRRLTIAKAMSEAIAQEMRRDASVFVMGEDIGPLGGVFATTQGLFEEFGPDRVRDTPISEAGFIGAAVGAASVGMRPIVELMFVDFVGVCLDPIYNLAAKQSYFSGGRVTCPMVLMTSVGGGYSDAGQHSQTLYATFAHLPGLKVVIPSNARDAKGLMLSAIRDENPVIFMFHKSLQGVGWLGTTEGAIADVPQEPYLVPLGEAAIARKGRDVTLIGFGATLHHALKAAQVLSHDGVEAEVIDLRCLAPLDKASILTSVRKTGRVVVVDDDYGACGVAGEVVATIVEGGFDSLKAPPMRVTYPDVPVPFARNLEQALLPSAEKVVKAAQKVLAR